MDWKGWGGRLRTLRLQRGWTQQHLAGLVDVSRNTVNRWEMGERQPSMKMIEKLARMFKVTIQALLHDRLVPVKVVKFDPTQIFPLSEPFAIPLIGLMMAADDARHLQQLVVIAREKVQEAPEAERHLLNGELAHLLRLMCGHLHEAKGAFLDLEKKRADLVDAAVQGNPEGEAALTYVRRVYNEKAPKHKKVFIDAVRNFVAFHYNPEILGRALRKHLAAGHLDGTLIMSPHAGIGRYTMTDNLTTLLLSDELGGQLEGFQQKFMDKVGEIIRLVGALGLVVDHVVGYLLFVKSTKHVTIEDGVVRVDPLIEQARRAVETMRRAGASA